MAFFASPAKGYLIRRLNTRNQKKGGGRVEIEKKEHEEERAHPLQGLPSDFTAEVDEAVEEIKREVEARRRKGSVGVSMPKGEEMRAAVEDKLGRKIA